MVSPSEDALAPGRRAVTPALKDSRRDDILAAALALFRAGPYEGIAMADVAAASGVAKGTLYLYVRSKEALFLALLAREFHAWFADLAAVLAARPSAAATLDWIAASLDRRRDMLRLAGLAHAILERNITMETARDFKRAVLAGMAQIAPALAPALGLPDPAAAMRFLLWLNAAVVGLQDMADPAPVVRAAIAQSPDLAPLAIDFAAELRALLGALLSGLDTQRPHTQETDP
jgi:AcrR family transcriptional regulator